MKNRLRVLSYNTHKGFDFFKRKFVLTKMKDEIRRLNIDLVFLQEVQGEHSTHREKIEDYPKTSHFEYFADEVWSHYAYGKNAIYSEGHHGNAILTKFPFNFFRNINLTVNRFEGRGLLHGIVRSGSGLDDSEMHLLCTHLNLLEMHRQKQYTIINEYIEWHIPKEAPLLLCGDFNDWSKRAEGRIEKHLGLSEVFKTLKHDYAKTFPSKHPLVSLDRIYFRNLKPLSCEVLEGQPWNDLSDHSALFCEFEL